MIDLILFGILFVEVISVFIIKVYDKERVDTDIPPINDD